MARLTSLLTIIFLTGCLGTPENVEPVETFQLKQYLGTWYEIARLDHSFERGLEQVSATYSLQEDGGVRILNKGFSIQENEWREAEGKAYFVQAQDTGHLKVSFFGPFYSSYVIFELDQPDYQYAFVSGYNKSYLWLLARTPQVSNTLKSDFVSKARELGFNVDELIFVPQKSFGNDQSSTQ